VVSLQARKKRRRDAFLSNTSFLPFIIQSQLPHLQLAIHAIHLIRISNKHDILTIDILVATLAHAHLTRRQLPALRLERIDLGRRDAPHVLGEVLVPRHDDLAIDVGSRVRVGDGALRFAKNLACHERELVGAREEDVKGGLELEDGFEDAATAENVQTQPCAGERDGQAAYVAQVAD
jgi:hypothetical protein